MELPQMLHQIMLTDTSTHLLKGEYKLLGEALGEETLKELLDRNIFIDVMLSPSSTSTINKTVPQCSKIISIDVNGIKIFNERERVAIILHEIGHALFGRNEFEADKVPCHAGYGPDLISSLKEEKKRNPKLYDLPANDDRIEEVEKWIINNPDK